MLAFFAPVEILVVRSIEPVEPIEDILRSVAVDHIEKNHQTHAVGGVYKLFQVLRRAVAATCGKEIVDLVSEARVVGVLHDRHELDCIVPQVLNSR